MVWDTHYTVLSMVKLSVTRDARSLYATYALASVCPDGTIELFPSFQGVFEF